MKCLNTGEVECRNKRLGLVSQLIIGLSGGSEGRLRRGREKVAQGSEGENSGEQAKYKH